MRWLFTIVLLLACGFAHGTVYYVSETEDHHTSTGNAGTFGDPYGLQEAIDSVTGAGDEIRVMRDGDGVYTLTAKINFDTNKGTTFSPILVVGADSSGNAETGTKPTIVVNAASAGAFIGSGDLYDHYTIAYFDFDCGSGTFDYGVGGGHRWLVRDCDFTYSGTDGSGYFTHGMKNSVFRECTFICENASRGGAIEYTSADGCTWVNCYAENLITGFPLGDYRTQNIIANCVAKDCTNGYISRTTTAGDSIDIAINCLAYDCTDGFVLQRYSMLFYCTSVDNSSDGVYMAQGDLNVGGVLWGCSITHNGGYGINYVYTDASAATQVLTMYCNWGTGASANTSGIDNRSVGASSTDSEVAPSYQDRASDDYRISTSATPLTNTLPGYGLTESIYVGAFLQTFGGGGIGYRIDGGRVR